MLTRKGRDPPWCHLGPFTFTLTGLYPRPTKEVLSHLHCVKACSRESSKPGGRERDGSYLIISISSAIQEGRNFSPGRAWKRDSLCKVSLSYKCGLWDGNFVQDLGLFLCGRWEGFAF